VRALAEPESAVPPHFSPGSLAASLPWLLPTTPVAAPGLAADQASCGDLVLRAASVVGAGHRCEHPATPRQDAYRVVMDTHAQYLVVAVADGMSDSARSDLGAQFAAAHAVGLLRDQLDRGVPPGELSVQKLFGGIANSMVTDAAARGLTPSDVRTTLALAIIPVTSGATGRRDVWAAQLADTTVWAGGEGVWRQAIGSSKDDFDGNALHAFLPHHPEEAEENTFSLPDGGLVAILTDGVSDVFTRVPGAAGWFSQRWRTPPPLASFLLDVDFDAQRLLDDRTAVVVWCAPPGSGSR
jgi:hypothetical protein